MARGNQRDKAREKNQKEQAGQVRRPRRTLPSNMEIPDALKELCQRCFAEKKEQCRGFFDLRAGFCG